MNKTRKIPIILASLTLATMGMGGGLSAEALSGVSQEILAAARKATDELSLKTDATDAYLKINLIKYKDGMANGSVSVPEEGDWYIKRVVVAYMNFSQGISEEEADANLGSLNEVNNRDWKTVSLYENYPWSGRKTQDITLNQAQTGRDTLANKSDIFYYAVEFGSVESGEWAETWWSRGKIDYRSCVHSTVFDEETMNCVRVEEDGEVKYLPQMKKGGVMVAVPENEQVLTWREEWRDVIMWEYEAVQNETELMWRYLNGGLAVLDRNDLALDGIMRSVEHYDKADSKLLWINQGAEFHKERIAEMRKFFEKSDGADTSKLEILEKENETLKQTNTTLESEKAELRAKNETLTQGKEDLEKEILRLRAENEALKMAKDDLEQGNEGVMSEIRSLRQEIERMTEEMAKMRQEADELGEKNAQAEAENVGLRQDVDRVEKEKQELEKKMVEMTSGQKCEIVNVVNEVKSAENSEEKVTNGQNMVKEDVVIEPEEEKKEEENRVEVPSLGGEEVKTNGVWWWLIPVVGIIGVTILLVKRKFSRE